MARLGPNRYGKAEVRVVHVARGTGADGADVITDRNVSMSLSGDLDAVHLSGDNAHILATDTQKNMVYVLAKQLGSVEPETFALALATQVVGSQPPITRARVAIEDYAWRRIPVGTHSFARDGQYVRTATVIFDEQLGRSVVAGMQKLVVLNTTDSEFWGFVRDEYTTLPETNDRMLATEVSAWWRFRATDVDWAGSHERARTALLSAFADTYSYSLQQTLYAIGERILAEVPETCEVRLTLPNKHHFLVDLDAFGLSNDNEVYFAADRPYGLIEGTVLADDAPPEGLAWT
ncbi:MAG: urate oxidase [Pseudonocardiales bacterium]|jgi:urate oxidase|nr:urate oxidase [Pseudonocardiales bacterium]